MPRDRDGWPAPRRMRATAYTARRVVCKPCRGATARRYAGRVVGVPSRVAVTPTPTRRDPMITLSWLLVIALIGGALALVDGILRLRARRGSTIVGIIEIVVAGLFLLALFIPGIPFGAIVLA